MKTVSPQALYETKISSGELQRDEGQADAVMHLENLFEALQPAQHSRRFGPIRRLFGFGKQAKDTVKGLYLYGGCLLYTSPSPRDRTRSRMPSSA